MNFSLIWAALVNPSKLFSTALNLIVVDQRPDTGASSDASFYPPLDVISYITNAKHGTYGGIFTAPADEETEKIDGTYNYCTMPHPSPDNYQLPSSVQKGTTEAQLIYVEYMQRHQRRTPYNILPGGEDQEYHCDNVHITAGSSSADSSLISVPIHGRDLWAVYGEQLKLLASSPDTRNVWFRASSSPLTHASASAVLRGIWPDYDGSLPLHQQASGIDTVDQGFPCPSRSQLLLTIQSTDEWNQHLAATQDLRDRLAILFNANRTDWMFTFDHFADNFQARLCNGYRLPCSLNDPSKCATEDDAYAVFRAGDWEWNYWWHRNQQASHYIQLTEGLFLQEIALRLTAIKEGTLDRVYSHTFIHDGDLGPILGALGIQQLRWPGMAANIAFEVWKTSDSELYVRVLYSGHPLRTSEGKLDWVPLSKLIRQLNKHVPQDIVAMCSS
ncbi:histidine acid phosphatase [Penicillium malachiteum]|uniref:histidine acid phosphatase n=1 Tax=Penicillium malachiteum TaxID=1324776 RepID=UPI002548A79B|nr:histidine acid phosphatase [Penicillium malachiteum]KAJ5730449.1 histidine acid phosphatase [Penicillium malachiteum]